MAESIGSLLLFQTRRKEGREARKEGLEEGVEGRKKGPLMKTWTPQQQKQDTTRVGPLFVQLSIGKTATYSAVLLRLTCIKT